MLQIAIEAAREAGKVLKQHVGKVRTIEYKEGYDRNLVTEVDKKSEELIVQKIKKHYPGHEILAEERGNVGKSKTKWVIDPLDGTTNFTHGLPCFCVSIGVEHDGELVCGVIYDPNFDELFTAEKGKGAFLNGKRIHVSQQPTLSKSMLVTGFPYNIVENPNNAVERFVGFLMNSQAVRRMGSAAIDLAYVACGRFDGFWEVSLNPWDMAAGVLLVREAGGTVTNFAGGHFSIYEKEIAASNTIVHQEMIENLRVGK